MCGRSGSSFAPGSSVTRIGSMSFFCALGMSQWMVTPSSLSLMNTSSLRQTGLSPCSSEKNS